MTSPRKQVRLKHSLIAHPPYRIEEKVTIPRAATIEISDYDQTDTDSLVIWNGTPLVVDKDSLISFEEQI